MPSHCCLSLSLIGQESYYGGACDLSGSWTSLLIPGQGLVRGRREEQVSGLAPRTHLLSTTESCSCQVSCCFELVFAKRTKCVLFLLSSSLAFENVWVCWRRRKITNFVQSESSISGRGAAKKAYSIAILLLKCPCIYQGSDFLLSIK